MKRYVKASLGCEVSKVSPDKLNEILDSADYGSKFRPLGYFYAYDPEDKNTPWVAIDNSHGHAWTEAFSTEDKAIAWLNGEFEVGEE